MKKVRKQNEDPLEIDVSSLIDVCFLLLIYFLVTSSIAQKEQDLSMALPSSSPSQSQVQIDPLYIYIAEDHSISINRGVAKEMLDSDFSSRNLPLLEERLSLFASVAKLGGTDPLVQLESAGGAKQQRLIDVLNALEKFGVNRIVFLNLDSDI